MTVESQPWPENPMRAVVLGGAALATMSLSTATAEGWRNGVSYTSALLAGVLAVAAYLIGKPGAYWKVTACLLALGGVLVRGLDDLASSAYRLRSLSGGALNSLGEARLLEDLLSSLAVTSLVAAVVVAAGWAAVKASGSGTRKQTTMAALFAGGACLVMSLVEMSVLRPIMPGSPETVVTRAANLAVTALGLALAVKLVAMLCLFKSRKITTGAWARAWFIVCFVATVLGLVVSSALTVVRPDLMHAGRSGNIFGVLLGTAGAVGYLMLVRSRRLGYVVILLSAGLSLFAGLADSLLGLLVPGSPAAQRMALGGAGLVLSSLAVAVNPAITGLVLAKAWKTVPTEPAFQPRRVKAILRVGSIACLALGLACFLVSAPFAYWAHRPSAEGLFVAASLLAAAVAAVGLFATVAAFTKSSAASRALPVVASVLASLMVVVVVPTTIVGLVTLSAGSDSSAGEPATAPVPGPTYPGSGSGEERKGEEELPVTFSAYDSEFTITSFVVEQNGANGIVVKVEGEGFDTVMMLGQEGLTLPVGCSVIIDGKETDWQHARPGADGIEWDIDATGTPETVVFYPTDNPSKRVELPVN
ncbi:MAG: hypothetical protein LBJ02_10230 [Bifidobacteriaceae bacterium]|jgi:hypothetical protein|nr:hypothetical protein [Bifidobacteriaceae bacterium]